MTTEHITTAIVVELERLRASLHNIVLSDGLARLNALRAGDPPPPFSDDEIAELRKRIAVLWDCLAALRALEAK